MARPKNKIPSYLPHPASGQARVRVNGRDFYLGPFGSPESKQAYARFIAENFGNGEPPSLAIPTGEKLCVAALMLVAARLRHIAGTKWGTRQYLDMQRLREQALEEAAAQPA